MADIEVIALVGGCQFRCGGDNTAEVKKYLGNDVRLMAVVVDGYAMVCCPQPGRFWLWGLMLWG